MNPFLAGFFEQGRPQSMTRLVAFGCLLAMALLALGADVMACAYAWAIVQGRTASDPSGPIAALGVPIMGLAGAAYGALQQRVKGATDASLPGALAPRLTQALDAIEAPPRPRVPDPVDGILIQPRSSRS